MVKSVIRAGCDVDHFHRGHTPLMMASIRGHDDVVKELILAGCKVDLPSSKCFIGWFRFITKMALAWPSLVVWAMVTLFVVMGGCYWLVVLTIALDFLSMDSFKVSGILRMKSRTKVMAWAGIVPAVVLVCIWRATAEEAQVVGTTVPVSMTVLVPVLMAVTGIGVITVLKGVTDTGAGAVTAVLAVAGAGIGAWFEVGAEIETLVRTGTVGMVVTVTGILALTLTVAKAGTEALPLLFGAIMTVAVTTVGTWGLALGDAFLQPDAVSMTSAVPAIGILALPLIEVIKRLSSVSGMTALHYAAWYDHITCGTHLVEAGANVQAENKYFRTPLHICSHSFGAAAQRTQPSPPKQVIAVIGNTEYGKSTLIAALQSESRTLFQRLVYKLAQVHNIKQRTAGIETVPFSSAKYGEVLFYDFAGQSDYHGPHQPFLEAMLSKPGMSVTVLLLVKVTERQDVITQQLIRWLQPLALASTPSTPHVIVVGSFLDREKSKKEAHQKLQGCIESVQKEYPSLKLQEFFLLDCRQPESAGIKGLCSYLQRTQPIRTTSGALLYNIHWVMAQLQKTTSEQSLQLQTFEAWLRDNAQSLPSHLPPPEDVCKDLSAAGYILFLRSKQDLSQSWLVLDLQTILHNVYGTLFSPSQDVVNQFGLLHCSHLSELFLKLDPKMIQEVLITLEFCIRVDPLLLKEEMLSLTEQEEVEGWLYFPAPVSAEADEGSSHQTHIVSTGHAGN